MNWHWPQWVMMALYVFVFGSMILKDIAQPTVTERLIGMIATVVVIALINVTLYFGGFWTPT